MFKMCVSPESVVSGVFNVSVFLSHTVGTKWLLRPTLFLQTTPAIWFKWKIFRFIPAMPNHTDLVWQMDPNRQSVPGPFVEFRRGQTQRRSTNRRRLRMEPPRRHPRFQSHASHPAPTSAPDFVIDRTRCISNPSRTLIGRRAKRLETWGPYWRSSFGECECSWLSPEPDP